MTPIERLTAVAASLPPEALDALIVLAERIQPLQPVAADVVFRRLAEAPEEDVGDDETAAELRTALASAGTQGWVTQEAAEQELNLR